MHINFDLWPSRNEIRTGIRILAMAMLGGLFLAPLFHLLPILGWDWYFFFNANNPEYNLLSPTSAYPPFTRYFISSLTWMDWRWSLAVLNSLTIVTVALAAWHAGGRYGSVVLAILTPPLWFLFWDGQPDGLALLGATSGLIPLALIKPQLTAWSLLRTKKLIAWTTAFLGITLLIWWAWPLGLRQATFDHPAAFGWQNLGWPILGVGIILLLGAGNNLYRLMAAGSLISPYMMPYSLALLAPAIGQVRGPGKILVWSTSWLVCLGVGLGGTARYLNFVFPLAVYVFSISMQEYRANLLAVKEEFGIVFDFLISKTQLGNRNGALNK